MPANLSTSSRDAIVRSCLGRILASHTTSKRRRTFGRQVLHFDFRSESLTIWFWPVYDNTDEAVRKDPALENARVPPSDLEGYRRKHELKAPCCLCALMDDLPYTESRIGLAGTESSRTGAYIADLPRGFLPCAGSSNSEIRPSRSFDSRGKHVTSCSDNKALGDGDWKGRGIRRDFWIAIAQCPNCQWLLPKLELQAHVCKPGFVRRIEVIDLTEED
ncbi:hypothetical protein BKA70DRAFT_1226253 [Coprinopsis sp. MPI-PUGE-AT-0042]|nr:hypothetical protein BKA70DRAFT_1226253 [Coprinopsis sp. MPI-PUGE-AT-0042]